MARGQWPWGDAGAARARHRPDGRRLRLGAGLDVWKSLPAWEEPPPQPPPSSQPVEPREARLRLAQLIAAGPDMAEARPTQSDYASAASQAFAPREQEDKPNVVLVEAGTGVGKTLGYVAPASLWAEKNGAPVWIATYTRNLQRQIDNELDRLHRDSAEKRRTRRDPQGPRELSLPAELPGSGDAHRPRAGERRRASACWRAGRWPAATAT